MGQWVTACSTPLGCYAVNGSGSRGRVLKKGAGIKRGILTAVKSGKKWTVPASLC